MTDKPTTLSLAPHEWRTLIVNNLAQATEFVQKNEQLTLEQMGEFGAHLDRVKHLVAAWRASAPATMADLKLPGEPMQQSAQSNGAVPERKKGGWPKGRKRNQPVQVVTQ